MTQFDSERLEDSKGFEHYTLSIHQWTITDLLVFTFGLLKSIDRLWCWMGFEPRFFVVRSATYSSEIVASRTEELSKSQPSF